MMLEETATVVAVDNATLWVETEARSACHHCSSGECTTSVVGKLFGVRRNRLALDNHLGAKVGDQVVIGIPDNLLVSASLWGYMFPLLGMIGLPVIGSAWGLSDGALSVLAMMGLAGGLFLLNRISAKAMRKFRPELLRISGRGGEVWLNVTPRFHVS
jgi:sigma-E factor negative regulatory protein RseC